MQSGSSKVITIVPEEIVFPDIQVGIGYAKTLTLTNNINANIELVLLRLVFKCRT